ncbi:MAG: ATP-binding protein [Candidatus Dormibacter sp.]
MQSVSPTEASRAAPSDLDAAADLARFATVVSHDFSGPLRVIRGFAGLLGDTLDPGVDQAHRRYVTEIITATERMQALNDGLVACVRARAATMEFTEVSLDAVVATCLDDLGSRILDQGVRVHVSPLPVVHADAVAIRVVLRHLLDNALRYADAPVAPVIDIAATRTATEWTIVVRDNGPGIAEMNRERVFALFKRLDPARDEGRPGIGLTLCRTIVERHGGRLWIDAGPTGGIDATFTLPINAAPAADAGATIVHPDDITREQDLVDHRAALAAIVEYSDDAMYSQDLDGQIITWNRAAETLYGFSAAEAIGQPVSMLIPPNRVHELPRMLDRTRNGSPTHIETVRMRQDGRLIELSLTVSPIRDALGTPVAASVTARDVSERHRADEDLRAFLEVAPDAIVVIDATGAINEVNSQAEVTFGYAPGELVGQPLEVLLPERFRGPHVAQRMSFAANPVPRPMGSGLGLFGQRRDGTEFPVDIQLSSLPTKDGLLPVAAIRDVTERRRLEHLRDAFIGNAAHELRTPLTTLAGLGETLASNFDVMARTDIEDAFAAMARQGERARVLIANLLDLSNLEGGRADYTIVGVELGPLIDRVLEVAPPPLPKTVTVGLPRELKLTLRADAARLEQVMTNLLINAYRYGGNTIGIDALPHRDRVVLSVSDDGVGVAPELAPTIFEPFTRGKDANVFRGSGIGLALCRRIVEDMDGSIWYQPVSPHGSSFRVSLDRQP